jgi:hypothetical protein
MTCSLNLGPVVVIGAEVIQCNTSTVPFPHNSHLTVIGSSTSSRVAIQGSQLTAILSNGSLTSVSPFVISNSAVTLSVEGSNNITSTSTDHAGIQCADLSNISLQTRLNGI